MAILHGFLGFTVTLATSAIALAQPAEGPPTPSAAAWALELPPGYADRLPSTRGEWESTRDLLERRVESAQIQLDKVKEFRDRTEEIRVEQELRARKWALRDFKDRTTERNGGMAGAGILLCGGAVLALGATVLFTFPYAEESPEREERRRTATTIAGIGALAGVAAGLPMIIVGMQKTWKGPPKASAAARLVVGPDRLVLRGSF